MTVTWYGLGEQTVRKGWPLDKPLPPPRFAPLLTLRTDGLSSRERAEPGAAQLAEWRRQTGRWTPTPAPDVLMPPGEAARLRVALAELPAGRRRLPRLRKRERSSIVTARETPPGEVPGSNPGGAEMANTKTKTAAAKKPAGRKTGAAKKTPAPKKTPPRAPAKTAARNGGDPVAKTPREPRGGRALIADVLREADRPLHVPLIVERVLVKDRARRKADRAYNGKTPAQTISASLTVSANTGGPFEKTEPGVYVLRSATKRTKGKSPERAERKQRDTGGVDPTAAAHTTVVREAGK